MSEFTIPKQSRIDIFRIDTPIIPEGRYSVVITNTGLAEKITARFFWSHSFTPNWYEYSAVDIAVGETKTLEAPSNALYYSKVQLENSTESPAYITAD